MTARAKRGSAALAFCISEPLDPIERRIATTRPTIAAEAELASEILQLRRLCPDLEPADSPAWLYPAYRHFAHRFVGARSRVEAV